MALKLTYQNYLDKILGGWIGKSIGGTIGVRFEGYKGWIDVAAEELFPEAIPPNDDLDLQVLWVKVLEERGERLTSEDLAQAWLEHCWYPFNEYGIFRRNWRLGIHPPYSGSYGNAFWETGMGCPIRSEIWGYVFPGAPHLAAQYAARDGILDHTEQSVSAEQMLTAMAAMAFFIPDVRQLIEMYRHYLPEGTTIARLTALALEAYDRGLSLRAARELLLVRGGHPEACDARLNVPFTLLALLYGGGDLQETLIAALHCGYDTDCTLATSGALIGQILGAQGIPEPLKAPIGDQLVMGIAYHRSEMTLSALARDTARVGVLFGQRLDGVAAIEGAPLLEPLPAAALRPRLEVLYGGTPCLAPGESLPVTVKVHGDLAEPTPLEIDAPEGWQVQPQRVWMNPDAAAVSFVLYLEADVGELPLRNLFHLRLGRIASDSFGLAGAGLWRFLGVYFDPLPPAGDELAQSRAFQHHFVDPEKEYLPEPDIDVEAIYRQWTRRLGQPSVVVSRENEVDVSQLVGLRGEYVAYLSRTVLSAEERKVYFVVGNSDAFRLYLNGDLVMGSDECIWWTPFNHVARVTLRRGANGLLLKLVKRGKTQRFTFGIREAKREGHNLNDWCVDLADRNPLTS